ncbi:MAG: NADH/ubiquinone/plastoquinone (complex I) [Candidatus Aminicenantes bacterium RBG_13_63_10]|nr:MAG: NADH/ubiquinone/plastoquinone (complex I) [Candidatus Aminicenantes bacterium RBG_13_63_10]
MIPTNAPALIPLLYLFTGLLIPLAALRLRRLAYWLALAAAAVASAAALSNIFRVLEAGTLRYRFGGWPPPVGIEYVLDPLSAFLSAVINAVALVVLVHARRTVEADLPERKHVPYFALVMLMMSGFNGIVMTGDFFNLYVFLEICSLALYGLVAVGDRKSPVAAFRYLVLGMIGGCFYLLGVGFLYMSSGSLNMADMKAILAVVGARPEVIVALCFMILGFGIKMALFPLHGWLPDAYTYAPTATSSLIAPIGTKIGAYGLIRVLFFVFGLRFVTHTVPVAQVIAWLGAAGILYGSVMAMAQDELKRMLAFSSVAQVGYIGLGIGLANPLGLLGAVLHVLNHGLMKACLFLVAGNFRLQLGHSRIPALDAGTRRRMPWTSAAFTLAALSMIGLPPTVGFFSKWYLALGTIRNRSWVFLAVILVSSLLNAVYFFRVIERLYLRPAAGNDEGRDAADSVVRGEAAPSLLLPTLVLAASLIIIGLLNAVIVKGLLVRFLPPGLEITLP